MFGHMYGGNLFWVAESIGITASALDYRCGFKHSASTSSISWDGFTSIAVASLKMIVMVG